MSESLLHTPADEPRGRVGEAGRRDSATTVEAAEAGGQQVQANDQGRMRPFLVKIKWVNSVDISALMKFIKCAPAPAAPPACAAGAAAFHAQPACTSWPRHALFGWCS